MKNRTIDQARIHDMVINETVKRFYNKEELKVHVNLNAEKKFKVGDYYPDIVVIKNEKIIIIEEVETVDSINFNELEEQWLPYSKFGYKFILDVPKEKLHETVSLTKNLKCEIWYYEIKNNKVISFKYKE